MASRFGRPVFNSKLSDSLSLTLKRRSDNENFDLKPNILDLGAEVLIRAAAAAHSVCDDVCFAALRDLGCEYEATLYVVT